MKRLFLFSAFTLVSISAAFAHARMDLDRMNPTLRKMCHTKATAQTGARILSSRAMSLGSAYAIAWRLDMRMSNGQDCTCVAKYRPKFNPDREGLLGSSYSASVKCD